MIAIITFNNNNNKSNFKTGLYRRRENFKMLLIVCKTRNL